KDTDGQTGKLDKETRKRPPVISGIAGAYSLNDSWLIGFGHMDNWLNDSFRYSGGLGYGSLNLDFYGLGKNEVPGDPSIRFNIESFFLYQDLKYRLFKSDFFSGARYLLLNTESVFDISDIIPGIPPEQFDSKDGGLGPVLQYDTRDNIFTPSRGNRVDISAMFHDPTFGGDSSYQRYNVAGFTWLPVHEKVTLGLRLEGSLTDGDTAAGSRRCR
ncbi:MAG: BamA/TamA family outer membrane protein, partial [Deltaproteobacteria bacterium]|nr:BamA/TamA family outer membrane protein [Deltaproteobacteria bacterium]